MAVFTTREERIATAHAICERHGIIDTFMTMREMYDYLWEHEGEEVRILGTCIKASRDWCRTLASMTDRGFRVEECDEMRRCGFYATIYVYLAD